MDKDYYKILEVSYTANEREIKKSYRQLALKFHPDRNQGDSMAETQFREVQEAYEVLSHPGKRSAYNQQRWYRYNSNKTHHQSPVTTYSILHKCNALNRYLSTLDNFDINKPALNKYILQLLSEYNMNLLIKENDSLSNEAIINELLKSANSLPFKFIPGIVTLLIRLAGDNRKTMESIRIFEKNKKISHYWALYLPLIIFIVSILICLFIYFVSNIN